MFYKVRTSEDIWDTIYFLASFWASCTSTFKGISLNVVQLDWFSMCRSKVMGLARRGRNFIIHMVFGMPYVFRFI